MIQIQHRETWLDVMLELARTTSDPPLFLLFRTVFPTVFPAPLLPRCFRHRQVLKGKELQLMLCSGRRREDEETKQRSLPDSQMGFCCDCRCGLLPLQAFHFSKTVSPPWPASLKVRRCGHTPPSTAAWKQN